MANHGMMPAKLPNQNGYQHGFLITAVTPYPQVHVLKKMAAPVVEGFLEGFIRP